MKSHSLLDPSSFLFLFLIVGCGDDEYGIREIPVGITDFTMQEPVFYERLQIGATAKVSGSDVALLIDNVRIRD